MILPLTLINTRKKQLSQVKLLLIIINIILFNTGLGRITENTPKHQGVVIYSMSDIPLGFGVTSRSTTECRHADPLATIAFHQADIGEYIRSEDSLT